MEIKEFLSNLEELNFSLSVEGEKLNLNANKAKVTKEQINALKADSSIIEFIKNNKDALVKYLTLVPKLPQAVNPKDITSIYRLSGLQEGMLFHSLYNDEFGSYIEQFTCDLIDVNVATLINSWAEVIKRHSILRTAFYHDSFSIAVQCVYKQVSLPTDELDYRGMDKQAQLNAFDTYLDNDRKKGFDFKAPPLMRLAIFRLDDKRYKMLWTSHHILFDGWSMPVLIGEFLNTYELLLKGEAMPSSTEDKYEDFIRYLERRDKWAEESYWTGYLKKISQGAALPFIKKNDQSQEVGKFRSYAKILDKAATALVHDFAKKNHVTVNTLMQGVWSIILNTYTNSPEILFGVVVSGRPEELPNVEERVGLFINTIPFKAHFDKDDSTLSWLKSLQADQVESRNYQFTNLQSIKKWTGIKDDLFDSILVFENYPVNKLITSKKWSLQVENVNIYEQTNYPLTILIADTNDLNFTFNYNAELIDTTQIQVIAEQFVYVLSQITSGLSNKLNDIAVTTPAEAFRIKSFNQTAINYPKEETIVSLFEAQAAKTPGAIALVFEDQELSYLELNKRSNQLARYLRKQGVTTETLVAICLERGFEMLISILGILKAGAAYVPIDPEYPADRISFMLDDTGSPIVLSSSTSVLNSGIKTRIIALDSDWGVISESDNSNLDVVVEPNQLAYVIYTSGSTGNPKGAMNEHGALVNRLMWAQSYFQLTNQDIVLQKTTFSFDVSVWELLWPVICGAKLVFAKPGGQGDSIYLRSVIDEQNISMLHFVPSMLNVFLLDIEKGDCSSLKNVLCSGEALTVTQVKLFREKLPNVNLHNLYGPTEAAIDVTYWSDLDKELQIEVVPIGRPVSNTRIHILGGGGNEAPIGVPGEICIGGVQVARGYLNRAELTAEKFVRDPYSEEAGARLYRTGDVGRWLADGNVEYLGRIDDQVKIRGYRIELGEIESVLLQHNGIRQAVVLARADAAGNRRLTGYIVAEAGMYDKDELESYLGERLPEYMVPRLWVELESLPLTANGKTDKKALPEADVSEQLKAGYAAAETELEIELVKIWEELLGVEGIGTKDNFFELGGHSLLAMRVISRLRQSMGVELQIRDLFRYPRIGDLAARVPGLKRTADREIGVQVRPAYIPLSYSQERLWFIDRLEGSVQYHVPGVLKLSGKPDVQALEASLRTIVNRHEVLRTVIREHEGQGYQEVKEKDGWQLKQTDLSTITTTTNSVSTLDDYIAAAVQVPFDLSSDDMLRAELIKGIDGDYALLVVMHHIASDGWSMPVLVGEFRHLYGGYTSGREVKLSPLEIQYADYSIWQRATLSGALLEQKLDYWKTRLSGVATLQLPGDHTRPAVQGTAGSHYDFMISKAVSKGIQGLSLEHGVTPYMTLLSVFKVLLYRYSGQEDICVGSPVANRDREELSGLIGFFVNTLALRSSVKGETPFRELLAEVRETTLAAYEHQDVPFEKVVEAVVKERDLGRSPLFQVMFVLQNMAAMPELTLGDDIRISAEAVMNATSKYDLGMNLEETPEGIRVSVEYNTELYEKATIVRLSGHYLNLLDSVLKDPDKSVGELEMLGESELEELRSFNDTGVSYPQDATVISLFEAQAASTPGATALVFEGREMSYGELNSRSNQLARYLVKAGVQKETLVVICLERGFEMLISILGIMKAGGAYVPVDPEYPAERIGFMLSDTGAPVVLCSSNTNQQLQDQAGTTTTILIDGDWTAIAKEEDTNLGLVIDPGQLAYVIYTSGSTGKPKGVMVEHGNVANYSQGFARYFTLKATDIILQQSSVSFDTMCEEVYPALLSGAKIIIVKEGGKDIDGIKHFLEHEGVTILSTTPTVIEYLNKERDFKAENLRYIISGGEMLHPGFISQLSPKIQVVNTYGPSEGTVCATYHTIADIAKADIIGRPVSNTRIHILGAGGNEVPIGVPGEICIGGVQVARGYLNRAELTAEKFVRDPYSEEAGARLYRTGDVGRWLADGNVEYLGRIDDQVKIRGYRIELGEIESVLLQHNGIRQAVVLARADAAGNRRLTGYIVAEAGTYDKDELESYLGERLPEYMVPRLWVELESLPLTANGKTDKKALPEADVSEQLKAGYAAAETELEIELVKIWEELLGVEGIGTKDNFFELGGHSLLAMRVISRLRQSMGVELQIRDLFRYPRIGDLAARVPGLKRTEDREIGVQVRPAYIPLSYSQERLWFIDRLEGSVQYHVPGVLRLDGKINEVSLELAIRYTVNRHEVLRTVIREHEGQAYQYIKPTDQWTLTRHAGGTYAENELKAFISDLVAKPFDLSADDMLRADLITIAADSHILVLTTHHIGSDAWSMPILVNEIASLYVAYSKGTTIIMPKQVVQFADYTLWQKDTIRKEKIEEKLQYWVSKLDDVATLHLPTDFKRPASGNIQGATAMFAITKDLGLSLNDLSKREGVTLYMTLLSVFNILLYRYSGQEDICVGTSIAGRPSLELEKLVGFFVNTLALRNEVKSEETFVQLLSQVKQTMVEAYDNQEVPFERVVEGVVKERTPGISPLFQVMLVLNNTPAVPEIELTGLQLSGYDYDSTAIKFDLTFFVNETKDGLQCAVQYNTNLYSAARIEAMMGHFTTLLTAVVADPQVKISALKMITSSQEAELINLGKSQCTYSKYQTIADWFETTVLTSAESNAVIFEDRSISYRELNQRSNKLAHHLRRHGVKADTLVPLYIDRGIEMIIGILGILKAGGAYVPIDTDYPAERINHILEDTDAYIAVSGGPYFDRLNSISPLLQVIELGEQNWELSAESSNNIEKIVSAHNLAYVIYTSGSTGKPKGVQITHDNLVDYVYGLNERTGISKCKTFALVSTIATDLGNTVLYSSLLYGGTLHVFSKELISNIEKIHAYFSDNRIDCIKIVPSHWKALSMDEPLVPARMLIFGGESLTNQMIAQIRQYSDCRIINHYGPTETTIGKLLYEVTEPGKGLVPIGRPFSNTAVYVLNKDMQLCPSGIPGQLVIGGAGLAKGYQNAETLTRQKFIANPYGDGVELIYQTGDQVQYNGDGNIQYLGRIDDQVKIRGYRVEPEEISRVITGNELVSQAVVISRVDKQGSNQLVGYVIVNDGFDRDDMFAYLKKQLPDYMIPSFIMPIKTIPLTASGKIDRKSLPYPEVETTAHISLAPRNDTEIQLLIIWQKILEEETISIDDDFFELGGHSLLAVRLVSAIRKAFSIELPISDIFDYPSIRKLAERLSADKTSKELAHIEIQTRPRHIPLSFSQERMWFIDKLEGSNQYHVPAILHLKGALNIAMLNRAFQQIVRLHEVLRTVIREHEGQGYQYVKTADKWQLKQTAIKQIRNEGLSLQEFLQQQISQPFDLSQDYMLRTELIETGNDAYVLLVVMHHIASDGWSTSILVKELVLLYNALAGGQKIDELSQPSLQYADYSIWQRNYLKGDVLENKLSYWRQKLQNITALQLSTDYSRPAIRSNRGATTAVHLDKELLESLNVLSKENGVTLYMTLLSAFSVLLHRYSGQDDICIGSPVSGRNYQEIEGLIGFFINTLVLRNQVTGNKTFTELLEHVKINTLEAYNHQEVPFEKVVEAVVKERDMSRSPLFQVMFVLQNTPDVPELRLGDMTLTAEAADDATSKFDISLNLTEVDDGLIGGIEYNTDLFKATTVDRMIEHFTTLLRSVVATPGEPLGKLNILSVAEENEQLKIFNATDVDYPTDKSVVDMFELQAAKTPDLIAVEFNNESITYQSLDEKSNSLARYLRLHGVNSETFVPICIERGINMIVGILGIMKAGGAYVPIDPEIPQHRIDYLLKDTLAKLVISSSANKHKFENADVVVAELDKIGDAAFKLNNSSLGLRVNSSHLAYVIYTSGSTGKPKGVMVEHKSLVNLALLHKPLLGLEESTRVLQFASFSFDASCVEIFSTLLSGGRLVMCEKEILLSAHEFEHFLTERRIEVAILPPSFQQLIEKFPTTLKVIISAGEALNEFAGKHIQNQGIRLFNGYGPTEGTVCATMTDDPLWPGGTITIGKAIDNVKIYILNQESQLNPLGVTGEICIGGIQVARGYLNKPELTAEKFIKNPFSNQADFRLYRTGDLGRWLADGSIEYLGRIDDQVKIRGYRIELGEIENVLLQSDLVSQATVLARPDANGLNRLVAYVTTKGDYDRQALTTYLSSKLPDYMVPGLWVLLDRFPLTSNGKIDRRALPDPVLTEHLPEEYVASRNTLEAKLQQMWSEVLDVKQVGIHNNFFELGGHSILAMRLIALIRKTLEINIVIRDLFVYPTIAKLCQRLQTRYIDNYQSLIPIKATGSKTPLYIICGAGGTAFKFKEFSKLLDADQPIYVLQQPLNVKAVSEFPDTIEGIAERYISEMLLENPEGPYALSGHCLGGMIAIEMANQLQDMGKKVTMLAMFDADAKIPPGEVSVNSHGHNNLPYLMKKSFELISLKLKFEMFLLLKHPKQALMYKARKIGPLFSNSESKIANINQDIFDGITSQIKKASDNYQIKPYNGDIILFNATQQYYFIDKINKVIYKELQVDFETKYAWKNYAESLKIHEIKGEHSTIFDLANAREFSELLQHYLNEGTEAKS